MTTDLQPVAASYSADFTTHAPNSKVAIKADNCRPTKASRPRKTGLAVDLTGKTFGLPTVMEALPEQAHPRRTASRAFLCSCVCDNPRLGRVKSCGCLVWKRQFDRVGQRYGWLVVVDTATGLPNPQPRWWVRCDCGRELSVGDGALLTRRTPLCGCQVLAFKIEAVCTSNKPDKP